MASLRLFVALDLPPAMRDALMAAVRAVGSALPGVRWGRSETLHLTLKFLGDTPAERVPDVTEALRAVLGDIPAGRFAVAGFGTFPNPRRPSVVWAGIRSGTEWLTKVAGRVDAALTPLGFAPEQRAFQPHITLGRVRQGTRWPTEVVRVFEAERPFGEAAARSAILYASTLAREGAIHDPLAELPFRQS